LSVLNVPTRRARWVVADPPDEELVAGLASKLLLPLPVVRLLLARGHVDLESAKIFLRPKLERLHDPYSMLTLDRAVERLSRAINAGELVLVHGDYDVDGICSTTLMVKTIRGLGGKAVPFIPRRIEDGYDLTDAGVNAAIAAGAKIVVTCDCGTSAVAAVAKLCAAGIDVIITDHHLPGAALPDCVAVLNPQRPGCGYPEHGMAAVGVAFKLALALAQAMGKSDGFIWAMLDLVALATVADVAPLKGENRIFVRYGLRMMRETENFGLRALIRAAGLDGKPLTSGRVGYILAPRLNAVGRLGHALRGVELLMSENEHDANVIARELEELNQKRQQLDRAILDEAREMVQRLDLDETFGIVLAKEGWHPGVIGIVASRIVEEFGRPTVLISIDGEMGKGSGRSISGFDLHAGLAQCSDLFLRFGGHRAAAGVSLPAANIPEFARRFNGVARSVLRPEDLVPEIRIDLEVPIEEINENLEAMLRHFEPFGMGNPTPVLVTRGVRLTGAPRAIGRDGIKLILDSSAGSLDAVGWGMAGRIPELARGTVVDIAFRLERDEYRGESRLQARIADIRVVSTDGVE
jgi:single-stranded-DNA-specific exonuclease